LWHNIALRLNKVETEYVQSPPELKKLDIPDWMPGSMPNFIPVGRQKLLLTLA
jgi:hypothetical protein